MPFHEPAGHWISYVAPSASVPFCVLTDPLPPHAWAALAAPALAVTPPSSSTAAMAVPVSFLVCLIALLRTAATAR